MILYADIYIIINALCDWLALWSCGYILSLKINHLRLWGGALFLAGYALASLLLNLNGFLGFALNLLSLCAGCFISYEIKSFSQLVRIFSVFFITCLMIGGAAGWIMGLAKGKMVLILCLTPVIYFAWLYITQRFLKRSAVKTVSVIINGLRLKGIVDSGNLLTEPNSGLAVIMVKASLLKSESLFYPDDSDKIEVTTVSGTSQLLCFCPESVEIGTKKVRAAVALSPEERLEYDCIVPSSLLN